MLQCNMGISIMATSWHGVTDDVATTAPVGLREKLAHIGTWVAERRARAQALRELQRMDERDLRDLRISPYDFNEIANGTYRR